MHRLKKRLRSWAAGGRLFGAGEVRLALLALLGEGAAHGYELMSRLEERCAGAYKPSAGTIYPTLQQLEDQGLIVAHPEDGKRTFSLTEAGQREVQAHGREIAEIWARTEQRSEWSVLQDPDAAEILGPALRLAKAAAKAVLKSGGDPEVIERIREILEEARERVENR
jgi:DNA-binding PadR family transcriptional regulator